MSGKFYNKYPYTDFHELNLDWVIEQIKKNEDKIDNFTYFNKITLRGIWAIDQSYPIWSVVTNSHHDGYLAIANVPYGVELTDTNYWLKIYDYDENLNNVKADVEKAQTSADNAQTSADNAQTSADKAQTSADNAQTAADNAQTSADKAQTAADNAQTSADKAQTSANNAQTTANNANTNINKLKDKHYMVVIGDSFSNAHQSGTPLWYTYVANQKNLKVYTNASDGMGFLEGASEGNTFMDQVNKAGNALKDEIVDIVYIFGGLNDTRKSHDPQTIANACLSCVNRCKQVFPNSKIEVYGPESFPSINNYTYATAMWMANVCQSAGVEYHNLSLTFNLFPDFFGGQDGNNEHPSASGEKVIASCILNHGALIQTNYVPSQSKSSPIAVTIDDNNVPSSAIKLNVMKGTYNDWYFYIEISGYSNIPTNAKQLDIALPGKFKPGIVADTGNVTYMSGNCYISQVGTNDNNSNMGWYRYGAGVFSFLLSPFTISSSMPTIRAEIAIHDR